MYTRPFGSDIGSYSGSSLLLLTSVSYTWPHSFLAKHFLPLIPKGFFSYRHPSFLNCFGRERCNVTIVRPIEVLIIYKRIQDRLLDSNLWVLFLFRPLFSLNIVSSNSESYYCCDDVAKIFYV